MSIRLTQRRSHFVLLLLLVLVLDMKSLSAAEAPVASNAAPKSAEKTVAQAAPSAKPGAAVAAKPVPSAPPSAKPVPLAAVQAKAAKTAPPAKPVDPLEIKDDRNLHMIAVEALVVEVNEERTRDLGITYGYNQATVGPDGSIIPGSGVIQGIDTRLGRQLSTVNVPVLINRPQGGTAIGSAPRLPGLGVSLVGMNVDSGAVSAQLRALLTSGDAAIRTRPVAVTLNRSKVHIETVNEVPTLLVGGGRQLNVDFRKVGVFMEVTPAIESLRPVGVATLDISRLEVSSVSNFITTRNVDRPVFTRSATETKVTLAAGETFVIGGLKTRRTVHIEERVPILGDIPGLGLLFRSQQDIDRNMDVLFFITPYILPPGQNFLLPYDFKNQKALGVEAAAAGS